MRRPSAPAPADRGAGDGFGRGPGRAADRLRHPGDEPSATRRESAESETVAIEARAQPVLIERPDRPIETTASQPAPGGWSDPDSSAFEPLAGSAAMTPVIAASLTADRTIDAQPQDLERD